MQEMRSSLCVFLLEVLEHVSEGWELRKASGWQWLRGSYRDDVGWQVAGSSGESRGGVEHQLGCQHHCRLHRAEEPGESSACLAPSSACLYFVT